ncbi:LysR family transcriptional regulator [Paracoccus ravus]|uniref:LysR family transcriptional regulator n=1 Tax=Paracoccus ravus TaxID=2447760 RepID=UPI00106E09C8|nr:LysR family transcriptional regulator [Paracoccus ravus]
MLNGQWLETFVTLCEVGHFTRAAERLNMTQPGVSQQLKKLEQQVGQALISRQGKSFTLTPAGESVLALGLRRRDEERALRQALTQDDPHAGEVTLACSGSLALLLYPHLLEMMSRAPQLLIRLEAAPQARILEGVLAGGYDLGIADHAPGHARLSGERLGHDELCLILPAGAPEKPGFEDLQQRGFIAHPDGYAHAEELLSANYASDFCGVEQLRLRSFINQIGQIPEPVARGMGYTILPRSGIDASPLSRHVSVARLAQPVRHELWAIQRKGRVLPARALRIREVMARAIATL